MKHVGIGIAMIGTVEAVSSLPLETLVKIGVQIIIGLCALYNTYKKNKKNKTP